LVAALNRWKPELSDAASTRLLAAWSKAAENVATAVENGDLKAPLLVLGVFAPSFGIWNAATRSMNQNVASGRSRMSPQAAHGALKIKDTLLFRR
jgi:hypothetical protein